MEIQKSYFCSSIISFCVFLFQLKNTQVFFDSERILNEFGIEVNDNKFIDDNNLIFLGIELNKEIDFYTAQKFIQLHDSIKNLITFLEFLAYEMIECS